MISGGAIRLNAQTLHNVKVALDEILTNIISYAYDDAREHIIVIRSLAGPRKIDR